MTSVMPLNDTSLSEQLAFKARCGTRNFSGRSRLPITGTSRSHLSSFVITRPCPILEEGKGLESVI